MCTDVFFRIYSGQEIISGENFKITGGKISVEISSLEDLFSLFKLGWIRKISPAYLKGDKNVLFKNSFNVELIDGLMVEKWIKE